MKPLNLTYASDCSVLERKASAILPLVLQRVQSAGFRDAAGGGKEYVVSVRSGLGSGLKRRFRIKH